MQFLPLAASALDVLVANAGAITASVTTLVILTVVLYNRRAIWHRLQASRLGIPLGLVTQEQLDARERELERIRVEKEFLETLDALEEEYAYVKKSSDRYPKLAAAFDIDEKELDKNREARVEHVLDQIRAAAKAVVRLHEAVDIAALHRRVAGKLDTLKERAKVAGISVETEEAFGVINDILCEFGELATEVDEAEANGVNDQRELAAGVVAPIYQHPVPEEEVETRAIESNAKQIRAAIEDENEDTDPEPPRKLAEPESA